jgi:hypothetical protein
MQQWANARRGPKLMSLDIRPKHSGAMVVDIDGSVPKDQPSPS